MAVWRAHQLHAQDPAARWLIESLWSAQAVGIIGGAPPCAKSLLALQLAVAVATGQPCVGRFATRPQGSGLLYNGEDGPELIRQRLEGLAVSAGLSLESLRIGVITAQSLLLDRPEHQDHLSATVQRYPPPFLVLDPFVRLPTERDENAAADVSRGLASLRRLSREHHVALALGHHARKQTATRARLGQRWRGSSEFHAWGDSHLYLQRRHDRLRLSVEPRAAPALARLSLRFEKTTDTACALALDDDADATPADTTPSPTAAADTIRDALATGARPLSIRELQKLCHIRTQRRGEILDTLLQEGSVLPGSDGSYLLVHHFP